MAPGGAARRALPSEDDWKWTLRSAANRPLLRWLEDGPLVVVSEKAGAAPKLKARLMATGQAGTFGENGERITVETENTPSNSRELLARVDFEPGSDAGLESMLGFRQELGFAGSVQSVAAVAIHPEIDGAGGEGWRRPASGLRKPSAWAMSSRPKPVPSRYSPAWGRSSPNTVMAALPYVSAAWHGERFNRALSHGDDRAGERSDSDEQRLRFAACLLRCATANLAFEHGFHQEIGWERNTDTSGMSQSCSSPTAGQSGPRSDDPFGAGRRYSGIASSALIDRASGILRSAGPGFSTAGFMATAEHRLPGDNQIRVSFANGNALAMPASQQRLPIQRDARRPPVRAAPPMYSISLSGTLEGTGTRWHASYRWQPEDTVTPVAAFASDAAEPFFNLHLPPAGHLSATMAASSLDVMLDVHNLLAQGFRPYVLTDGSVLMFAQDQRSICGGLAFTF